MKQLPQLQLCDKLDLLKTKATEFQMAASEDLPKTSDIDVFWEKVHHIKQPVCDEPAYSTLLVLVHALLALPASNADSERCLSMVRKIDSEDRAHLERTTVASLLTLKVNMDCTFYDFQPSDELLKLNKSAVRA